MNLLAFYAPLCCLVALGTAPAQAADAFQLVEGDRVVLLGNTLIEREQRYGYWETALTRRYPDKSITFRNLGWSGDTVFGEARAGFGGPADGFRHLKDHVLALKPTVLIIGYGANESFDGPAGLPRFAKGLETLLDALAPTKARVVLLSPLKQENLGRPLPDPTENNKNLRLYADAIRDVAKTRSHIFVDLYDLPDAGSKPRFPAPYTDNGIHLTAWGYWRSAPILEKALGLTGSEWDIEINADGKGAKTNGSQVDVIATRPLRIRVTAKILPLPSPPAEGHPFFSSVKGYPVLGVKKLPAGEYTLLIDGEAIFTLDGKRWAGGLHFQRTPDLPQVERLREAIIAKNRLYFYRWRPENETYLFGFRKHEQGQNAREIPQFDPLIAAKEKEIAKLRVPVAHTYELKAEKKP